MLRDCKVGRGDSFWHASEYDKPPSRKRSCVTAASLPSDALHCPGAGILVVSRSVGRSFSILSASITYFSLAEVVKSTILVMRNLFQRWSAAQRLAGSAAAAIRGIQEFKPSLAARSDKQRCNLPELGPQFFGFGAWGLGFGSFSTSPLFVGAGK